MRRPLIIITLIMLLLAGAAAARKRTSKEVRRDRQRTEQQITSTQKQINKNATETRRQLNRLTSIEGEIGLYNDTIGHLSTRLDSIDAVIRALDDSINVLNSQTKTLKAEYARTLRSIRSRRQGMSDWAFIFSSESFAQAWRRMRYLKEMAQYNTVQAERLAASQARLADARGRVETLRSDQMARLSQLNATRHTLNERRKSADALVTSLRRQGKSLNRELERRRNEAAALDRELDKVIEREMREAEERRRREAEEAERQRREAAERQRREAEEAERQRQAVAAAAAANAPASSSTSKTPAAPAAPATPPPAANVPKQAAAPAASSYAAEAAADRALTGSFKANKGRLLFPVAGRYTITSNFGTNTHPGLSKVKIDNLGIDIEVPGGTNARTVFEGVVSSIFRLEGYRNIVIVRHGEYLTVYGGLENLTVKKGDKLKTGQTIGSIYSDPDNDNRGRLHFEIRLEKQKLNPTEWVK